MVPKAGLEPARCHQRGILKLKVSPFHQWPGATNKKGPAIVRGLGSLSCRKCGLGEVRQIGLSRLGAPHPVGRAIIVHVITVNERRSVRSLDIDAIGQF